MGGRAEVVLPGGGAALLALRADVLACDRQRVTLRLDGVELAVRDAPEGMLDLRVPIPASERPRRVTVEWTDGVELSASDPRVVAARIEYLDLLPTRSPTALRIPESLTVWGGAQAGIDPDGWAAKAVRVVLAGGGAARLVVRGEVPETLDRQELAISIDGEQVLRRTLGTGPFTIDVPAAASDDDRSIDLSWTNTTEPASGDEREVAARLSFFGITTEEPPTAVTSKRLEDPHVRHDGLHPDGWLSQRAAVELRQERHTDLVVKARALPTRAPQSLEVRVDGNVVHQAPVEDTIVSVRVPVGDTGSSARLVELRWAAVATPGGSDDRSVAAKLAFLGFVTPHPPARIDQSTDLGDPHVETTGVHEDFWLAPVSAFTLAAGPSVDLDLRASLDRPRRQSVDVFVDGTRVGSASSQGDLVATRIPLQGAETPRRVELRWQTSFQVGDRDSRSVAARLAHVALEARRTSIAGRLFRRN